MDENIISTPVNTTIQSDALRALTVSAASVAGSTIGVAVVIAAVYGVDRVKTAITNRKNRNKD